MPIYEEPLTKEDRRPCQSLRIDLKQCLRDSDCVKIHHRTPRECLNANDGSVSSECQSLRVAFFECKRSMIDNRNRFRGRKE